MNRTVSRKWKKCLATALILSVIITMMGCKKSESSSKTNSKQPLKSDERKEEVSTYTYHDYMAGSPENWNAHEWQVNNESYVIQLTSMGLYEFVLNQDKTGYQIIPEMAAEKPVDVTKDYAGKMPFGVPKDAVDQYAYRVKLNPDAVWEDGTPINADTYIYSMQQLLNPKMMNYRAAVFTNGTSEIANAGAYNQSGRKVYSFVSTKDGYRDVPDSEMFFSLTEMIPYFSNSAQNYYNNDPKPFQSEDGTDLFQKYKDSGSYIRLSEAAKKDILTICANYGDTDPEIYKKFCVTYDRTNDEVPWDHVGLLKTGEYEIVFIFANPITKFNFYYNIRSPFLVYEKLYEENKKQTGDVIKTTYGTSKDNYMSCGPYKITNYQVDKQMMFEKNDRWYGYQDGKHDGQFQTTKIDCQMIEQQSTAMQLFLQGQLDSVELTADDMEKYRGSDYIVFVPQTCTSKLTFNGDYEALKNRESKGVNKTILSYHDFRKALAFAVDRNEFAAQCTATHKPGYGILNYVYVSDPDTGELYRNTPQAKKALCDFYGVENEEEITGYDPEKSTKLMTSAYEEAYQNGDIKEDDLIDLEFLVYQNDDTYVRTVRFIQDAFTKAAVGTPLEGRIHVTMTVDEDYYNHAKQGAFEIITSTWGGAAMDPYKMMESYAVPEIIYEYGFQPKKEELTIRVGDREITKTFYDWYIALCSKDYAVADKDTRNTILAAMEEFLLEECYCTPLYYRTDAQLNSRKVTLGSSEYIQVIGFGGFRSMTFRYSDEEWKKYCEENGNHLKY